MQWRNALSTTLMVCLLVPLVIAGSGDETEFDNGVTGYSLLNFGSVSHEDAAAKGTHGGWQITLNVLHGLQEFRTKLHGYFPLLLFPSDKKLAARAQFYRFLEWGKQDESGKSCDLLTYRREDAARIPDELKRSPEPLPITYYDVTYGSNGDIDTDPLIQRTGQFYVESYRVFKNPIPYPPDRLQPHERDGTIEFDDPDVRCIHVDSFTDGAAAKPVSNCDFLHPDDFIAALEYDCDLGDPNKISLNVFDFATEKDFVANNIALHLFWDAWEHHTKERNKRRDALVDEKKRTANPGEDVELSTEELKTIQRDVLLSFPERWLGYRYRDGLKNFYKLTGDLS